jgi:hypothetical protein
LIAGEIPDRIIYGGTVAPRFSLAAQPGYTPANDPLKAHSWRRRRNQKTKAGATLKPGNTGAFASNNSLPLHFPFTG